LEVGLARWNVGEVGTRIFDGLSDVELVRRFVASDGKRVGYITATRKVLTSTTACSDLIGYVRVRLRNGYVLLSHHGCMLLLLMLLLCCVLQTHGGRLPASRWLDPAEACQGSKSALSKPVDHQSLKMPMSSGGTSDRRCHPRLCGDTYYAQLQGVSTVPTSGTHDVRVRRGYSR
jgi:hypothetical protein